MNPWVKVGIVGGWTITSFAGGCYVTTKFDEASQAKALRAQIEATQLAVQGANDHAADLEKELASEREKGFKINQKMEAAVANVPDCPVPDRLVGVLNEAITAPRPSP
ncbi:hypothetical protein ACYOEI_05395 [Singulisphaera rosea]